MRSGFVAAVALVAVGSGAPPVLADEPSPPFRHSYHLSAASEDDQEGAGYLPLLVTRVPLESGDRPQVAVLMTYERNTLWELESRVERLEAGAVTPSTRTVLFRGKAYRYQQAPNAEAMRLLEDPQGTLPLHRMEVPIRREARSLRDELLRDLAGKVAEADPILTSPEDDAGHAESAGRLVSKLEVVDEPPWTETTARVRFTVENRGDKPHRLLRLRPGWLEYNRGNLHGWTIRIDGPGGEYHLPWYSGAVPLPTERDYIDLAPGEGFSTIIRLDEAARWDGDVRHPLPSMKGAYTVSIPFAGAKVEGLKFTVGGP